MIEGAKTQTATWPARGDPLGDPLSQVRPVKDLNTLGGDPRFLDLLWDIAKLHSAKQQDYGFEGTGTQKADPFANVRASQEFGVRPWVGALVRMNDKVTRLKSFARKGVLANESAEDSMKDISVYSLICLILYREENEA